MSEQVIRSQGHARLAADLARVGDRVVYTRAHEHPNGDRRSFLVEEVLRPLETMPPQHNARIVPVEGDKTDWSIRPLNILKHDNATGDAIEVFVAPGFLGNPDQWCWWESEYPEEGAIGGYPSKELALDDIARNESEGTHFHVSVITTPLIGGSFVSDVRRRGRGAWTDRRHQDAPAPLDFESELTALINRHSLENESDTPDFILAQYLRGCLAAFATAVRQRDQHKER